MTAMAGRRRARRRTARGREGPAARGPEGPGAAFAREPEDPAARGPEGPGAAFARDLEAVMVTFLTASRPACSGGGTSMRPSSFTGAAPVQSGAGGTGLDVVAECVNRGSSRARAGQGPGGAGRAGRRRGPRDRRVTAEHVT